LVSRPLIDVGVPRYGGAPVLGAGPIGGFKGVEAAPDHEARLVPQHITDRPDLAAETETCPQKPRGGEGSAVAKPGKGECDQGEARQPAFQRLHLVGGLKPDPDPAAGPLAEGLFLRQKAGQADDDIAAGVGSLILEGHEAILRIGAALAPLRDKGILIFGSGNVVHNLRAIEWGKDGYGAPYAHAFDDHVHGIMTTNPADLPGVAAHPNYAQAVPTPDHFIPSLYIAGVAAASSTTASALVRGYEYGSLSMTSYVVK